MPSIRRYDDNVASSGLHLGVSDREDVPALEQQRRVENPHPCLHQRRARERVARDKLRGLMHRTTGVATLLGALAVLSLPVRTAQQEPRGRVRIEQVNGRDAVAGEVLVKWRHPAQPPDFAVLRARAAADNGTANADLHVAAARVFVSDAGLRLEATLRQALAAMLEGDALRTSLASSRRLFRQAPVNTVLLRRRLADEAVSMGRYFF